MVDFALNGLGLEVYIMDMEMSRPPPFFWRGLSRGVKRYHRQQLRTAVELLLLRTVLAIDCSTFLLHAKPSESEKPIINKLPVRLATQLSLSLSRHNTQSSSLPRFTSCPAHVPATPPPQPPPFQFTRPRFYFFLPHTHSRV